MVNPAAPKTRYVDVPGRSGALDFTEALLGPGNVLYENREGEWEFIVLNELFGDDFAYPEWNVRYNAILDFLNGRAGSCVLESDLGHVYYGRFTVKSWTTERDYSKIVIGYNLMPIPRTVVGITIAKPPLKTMYYAEDMFDSNGMIIMSNFDDNTSSKNTDYSTRPKRLLYGTTNVTVSYLAFSKQQPVRVRKAVSLNVYLPPHKTVYFQNEKFEPAGTVLRATCKESNDAITHVDVSAFNYDTSPINFDAPKVRAWATFGAVELFTDISILVKKASSLTLSAPPVKTVYRQGERFDADGMRVSVEYAYSNGTTASEITTDYIFNNVELNYGVTSMPIRSASNPALPAVNIPIRVGRLSSLSKVQDPFTTEYEVGEIISIDGLKINATYKDIDNNTFSYDINDIGLTPKIDPKMVGVGMDRYAVRITDGRVTKRLDVKISILTVSHLTITSMPAKTKYRVGERFNPKGLIIDVHYTNGSIRIISGSDERLSFEPAIIAENTKSVTAYYKQNIAQIDIPVLALVLDGWQKIPDMVYTNIIAATETMAMTMYSGSGPCIWQSADGVAWNKNTGLASFHEAYGIFAVKTVVDTVEMVIWFASIMRYLDNNSREFLIVRSADDGKTWKTIGSRHIARVMASTDNHCIFSDHGGVYRMDFPYLSAPTKLNIPLNKYIEHIVCKDSVLVLSGGINEGNGINFYVYYSTDNGQTWNLSVLESTDSNLWIVGLSVANNKIFLRSTNAIFSSTDGKEFKHVFSVDASTKRFSKAEMRFYAGRYYVPMSSGVLVLTESMDVIRDVVADDQGGEIGNTNEIRFINDFYYMATNTGLYYSTDGLTWHKSAVLTGQCTRIETNGKTIMAINNNNLYTTPVY